MTDSLIPTIDYENVFRSFDTAVIVFAADDPDFTIIEENDSHATMVAVSRNDAIGKPVLEVFPDTSATYKETGVSQLIESLRRVIATGESDEMPHLKYDIKDETGTLTKKYWQVVHCPLKDSHGKVTAIYQSTVDITERKSAEKNLEFLVKANQQFSASLDRKELLQTIASVVVESIADWCIIDLANDQGELEQTILANKDPEKIKQAEAQRQAHGDIKVSKGFGTYEVFRTGKPIVYSSITDELIAEATPNQAEQTMLRHLGLHSAVIVPLKVDHKVIGTITLLSVESQIHYGSSELAAANGLADRIALALYNANLYREAQHEIKERKHLQKQLEEANQALESRVKRRTQQLEQTNEGLESEITRRVAVEKELNDKSANLERSNQELQDFAYVASHDLQEPLRKIQAFGDLLESEFATELGDGTQYLERMRSAASRMSALIEDLLAFSRVNTKARPVVEVDLNDVVSGVTSDLEAQVERTGGSVDIESLPKLWADPMHMRQLFQNLIGNALKFHQPDLPPKVRVYAASDQPDSANHVICVEDNGIGFDEKYLDRIFSVFQRLHGRAAYEGTGIGLAVCRKIAERYDGTITATSKKGEGSTFIFTIPRAEEGARS